MLFSSDIGTLLPVVFKIMNGVVSSAMPTVFLVENEDSDEHVEVRIETFNCQRRLLFRL
uniref:Uncharacterized protein n=1 Tax=Tobacco rattle virus (strain SYM) TaxID=12298 RepID=G0LXX1_TRVSY|nr:hypothetical protein [Tobacco rattle virus-SYM]